MGKRVNTATWIESRGRWQINVQKDGVRKTFTSSKPGRNGQREANAKADAFLDDNISGDNIRIQEMFLKWFESLKLTTSVSNYTPLHSRWRTRVLPAIGHKKICTINEQHLQDIINQAYKDGLSKKSLQTYCSDMRAFFKYCRKSNVTTFNPENLSVPSGARTKTKQILQPSDIVKLFNIETSLLNQKIKPDPLIYAYRFQVLTGLRPGELSGLRWSDLKGHTLYVQRSINKYGEITKGKNENAVRSFVLSDKAFEILQQQKQRYYDPEYIFQIGTTDGYNKHWKKYAKTNGIAPITPYEMRHTFVSVIKSLPQGQIKQLVGHSKDMDTFGVYSHEFLGDKERAAENINEIFLSILSENASSTP